MISHLLWVCAAIAAFMVVARFRDRIFGALKRFDDGNVARIAQQRRDVGDPTAHFGQLSLTNSGVGHHDNFVTKLASEGVPLAIRQSGSKINLSWPSLASGLLLQQSTNLLNTNAWVTVPTITNVIELPATQPQSYFRLILDQ